MKNASELKELADDFNWQKTSDNLSTIETSMFAVAKKGEYNFMTINPLSDTAIEILKESGYQVILINEPLMSNGFCHNISWSK